MPRGHYDRSAVRAPREREVKDLPTRQSVVPAASAAPPATTAAASVFSLAAPVPKTKRQRALLDLDAVVIQSGIPVPKAMTGVQSSLYADLMAKLKPGDCVDLPAVNARGLRAHAKKGGIKYAVRKLDDERSRFWRLS